jgi:hypothetical protein
MSLNVYLVETRPTDVYENGITHNLGKMAASVTVDFAENGDELTLYDVLWRPDEHDLHYAHEIIDYLNIGLNMLQSEPEYYRTFTPQNHWGSYEGLVKFVHDYHKACGNNPMAEIKVSR